MLMSLLSMLGGGLMRLMPEVFAIANKSKDYAHELAMLEKQAELEKTRAAMKMEEVRFTSESEQALAVYDARKSALEGQMQKTGMKIVDAMNFLVRPVTTYYFLLIYGLAKLAMFILAIHSGLSGWESILRLYDEDDRSILAGILAFWFVGRVVEKRS